MSQTAAPVSVIVRTRDSAATVAETLRSIRAQSVPAQIVVVDSGSTDTTLALVEGQADVLLRLDPGSFSYGGSLNAGAAAASCDVHVALSSHSALPRTDWLAIAAGHVRGGAVAACGQDGDGNGGRLSGPLRCDHAYLRAHPYWGMSNHAAAWSARVWRRDHFDEQLSAAEDREWSWRVTRAGGCVVIDPALIVPGGHRRAHGVRPYYRRLVKEATALGALRPVPPYSALDAVRDWARRDPRTPLVSAASRAKGRTRAVEVAARWRAARLNPPPADPAAGG